MKIVKDTGSHRGGRPPGRSLVRQATFASIGVKSYGQDTRKAKVRIKETIDKLLADPTKELPLEFVLRQMNDEGLPIEARLECARLALPYVHSKKPIAIETSEGDEDDQATKLVVTAELLKELSNDELSFLTSLAQKLTIPSGPAERAGTEEAVEAEYVLPGQGAPEEGALPEAPGVLSSGEGTP